MIARAVEFLRVGLWRMVLRDVSRPKALVIKGLRVVILAFRGFSEHSGMLRASALTFFSMLSVVPVLAMVFGIAKGFGFEAALERQLIAKLPGQQEVVEWIINFAHAMLQNVKGGLIGGIGMVILVWAVINIIARIEDSFNNIWGVKRGRPMVRRFTDYLSVFLIGPALFILSSGLTVIISSRVRIFVESSPILGSLSPVVSFLLNLLPYISVWVLFTFIYISMPNRRVPFSSALLGGIVAGSLFQVFQWVYINSQIGVSRMNAIYGGFAALPLFLIWMELSWVIVLFGAELSHAHHHSEDYEFEPDYRRVSHSLKKLLGLRIVHLLVKEFYSGERKWGDTGISRRLEIPVNLVRRILEDLVESGIISRVHSESEGEWVFQPGRDPETLTVKSVVDSLERVGVNSVPVQETEEIRKLSGSLREFDRLMEGSPANMCLKRI